MFDLEYYSFILKFVKSAFYGNNKNNLLERYEFNRREKLANNKAAIFNKYEDLSDYKLYLYTKYLVNYAKYFDLDDILTTKLTNSYRTIANRCFL